MKWFDPINWQCEKTYGISEIENIYTHFQATLDAAQFDRVKVVHSTASRFLPLRIGHFSKAQRRRVMA